jgi:type IV pilus assembly protein PilZ
MDRAGGHLRSAPLLLTSGSSPAEALRTMSENEKPLSGRRADRLEHELPVAYRTVDGFITDWATNLSRGGMFINARNPLPVGTTVRIILQLPGAPVPFELRGRVTRVQEFDNPTNQVPGMGVEFVDVTDELKDRIERFVEQLRRELPEAGKAPGGSDA